MRVILLLLTFASTSAFGQEPETVTVTAKINDRSVHALPKIRINIDRGGPSIGIGIHEGGSCVANAGTKTTAFDALNCGFNDLGLPNLADVEVECYGKLKFKNCRQL